MANCFRLESRRFVNSCLANSPSVYIQLFRERLSKKVDATIPKDIVGGFKFTVLYRNLKELVGKAVEMCLRVLKESSKSRFDRYSRQKQCIDHIPYFLSGLSRAHFSNNLSRNSCIHSYKNLITSSAPQNVTDITRNA